MTVENQFPYQSFTANGEQTEFALGFYIEDKSNIRIKNNGLDVSQNNFSYIKSSNTITFSTAPNAGDQIDIERVTSTDRSITYATYNNSFRPEVLNYDLDRVWIKLQELGVADWILGNRINALRSYVDQQDNALQSNIDGLKNYTDQQDSILQSNINELKNYVDDKDDELRNYLLNAIREQGVALDQLEVYYNYLMEQLALIAVNRGWNASFVVAADGSTQQEINDRGLAYWRVIPHGYGLNYRVMLENGDVVRSTIDHNTVNPNLDMTGWVRINDASQIIDASGVTQQLINSGLPLSLAMFGADPTGTLASDLQIQAAFTASALLKRPIVNNSGTYLVNTAARINISYDFDLTGTVFKAGANFGGFNITRGVTPTTYTEGSSTLSALKTGGVIAAKAAYVPIFETLPELDNCYIKLMSSQQMFNYRGDIQTRMELNRTLSRGQLLSGFYFDFDLSLLTSVTVQKVAATYFVGKGLSLDETNITDSITLINITNGNGFRLSNFKFIDNQIVRGTNTKNKISISVSAHDIEIDGVDTSSVYVNTNNDSNYTLTGGENYHLRFKSINSEGNGWGATGFNNCRRVVYEDCYLNRVDFHKPCHEFLKISNCVIGNWGVLLTMLGDCTITDTRFLTRVAGTNNGIIRSRDDTGGWCNGNLVMRNITLEGTIATTHPLLKCQRNASYTIPAGSPIQPEFWTTVTIDGLYVESSIINYFLDSNQSAGTAVLQPPKKFTINNVVYNNLASAPCIFYMHRFAKRPLGMNVDIKNSNFSRLTYLDDIAVGTPMLTTLNGCHGIDNSGITVENQCDGNISISACTLRKYREYSGGWTTFSPTVQISDSRLINTLDAVYVDVQLASRHRIKLSNVALTYGDANAMRNILHRFKTVNATFNGSNYFSLYSGAGSAGTATFTMPVGGDFTFIVKNNVGKVDVVTIDSSKDATNNLANCSGTIAGVTTGSTVIYTVTAATLLSVGLTS